jgi:hypothetical protein
MEYSKERRHYRIQYPLRARPSFVSGGITVEVVDCSESGLRYERAENDPRPAVGSEFRGVIHFPTGDQLEVEGVIARVDKRTVAVRLVGSGIPYATILKEQRYLRRHYPMGSS